MIYSNKMLSIVSASAIAIGTCLPASLAFATPPDVSGQSGSGSTAMTMVWDNPTQEYGGTEDPNNPMEITDPNDDNYDPSAPGKNLSFKAPTVINFVAKANGTLLAPSSGSIHIDNYSAFGIHVSSMKIDQTEGWNIVADQAASSGKANAVWGSIGPSTDSLNWASYVPVSPSTDPIPVAKPAAWNMAAYDGETSAADQVSLATAGNVANLNLDLSTAKTFGTIHWYLTKGNVSAIPDVPADSTAFSALSATQLSALGDAVRSGDLQVSAFSDLIGATTTVTLGDDTVEHPSTAMVRFVDVTADRGLVFQFDFHEPIAQAPMNGTGSDWTNAGGWTETDMRVNLNSDSDQASIYATKLKNMTIAGERVDPVPTTLKSLDYNRGEPQVITTTGDKFWLASFVEIYGTDAWIRIGWRPYKGTEDCTQFAYYASLDTDPNEDYRSTTSPLASSSDWWLRSASSISDANEGDYGTEFMLIFEYGGASSYYSSYLLGVVPCFCL